MKKRRVFILAVISFVIALSAVLVLQKNAAPARLTTDEVAMLRGQYPVCSGSPPLIETVPLSLADCAAMADTFLYGEIEGEAQVFSQITSDFYEYTLVILSDTANQYKPGDRVTIAANILFKDYNPQFQDGMRIVTPIRADQNIASRTYFGTEGTYYVTPDGYALSAFEETDTAFSGLRVEALLEKLKEMQK
ncbi:hypothetical protein [Hominenteromicrobium sp.]|uniref:hypothetical protein n=1 Tax=Hominenteromicrobium sp. TaxID=3073581 RepID=UPI003AB6E0CC